MTTTARLTRTSSWIALAALTLGGCAVETTADDASAVGVEDEASEVGVAERARPVDEDGDGVKAEYDCDDSDPRVGAELFSQDFASGTSLAATPTLDDEWTTGGGNLSNSRGGQQALLGSSAWKDTVTFAKLSAHGLESKCRNCNFGVSGVDGHSLSVPGFYDNIRLHTVRFDFAPGARFEVDKTAGTARLFGTLVVSDLGGSRSGELGDAWDTEFSFTYRGRGAAGQGPDGPRLDQPAVQPTSVTDLWNYYDLTGGTMNRADGASATFTQRGTHPFQVGATANGQNTGLGAAVGIDYRALFPCGCNNFGPGDLSVNLQERDRFRAGILARASEDADQGEGFNGYRCAVARNSEIDCHRPGRFVQLAAFADAAEDDINGECNLTVCPDDPAFDQLDRTERTLGTDLLAGDDAWLTFWAVGNQLVCEFDGADGEHVVAQAEDDSFSRGTTGLSVLNALSDFDYVQVCEALTAP